MTIEAKKRVKKRSLDANALLWHCIGDIAKALVTDKDDVYKIMLQRYGKFTYICLSEKAAEQFKKTWRVVEEVGNVTINGKPAVQLLCYYGSSQLDSKEFSKLLDGVISEMKEMGLETPVPADIREAMRQYEERYSRQ